MNRIGFSLIAAGMLMAGCATGAGYAGPSEKVSTALANYERTGEMTTCLNIGRIDSIKALDERHFLVRTGVNSYYLNEPSAGCNGAGRSNQRIQYVLGNSQLCRNQIVTVVDNTSGIISGSCGLGSFERLEQKPADAEE